MSKLLYSVTVLLVRTDYLLYTNAGLTVVRTDYLLYTVLMLD
jgi:hypothetical protein